MTPEIVDCPVEGCDYDGIARSVVSHYAGKKDEAHSGGYEKAKGLLGLDELPARASDDDQDGPDPDADSDGPDDPDPDAGSESASKTDDGPAFPENPDRSPPSDLTPDDGEGDVPEPSPEIESADSGMGVSVAAALVGLGGLGLAAVAALGRGNSRTAEPEVPVV